ncbi:MAG TPA: hypothetical protein VK698_20050 [Kofleriaceae bacterium]|nr:hypothetical protein [Kofleriaceae bacterium]
MPTMAGLTLTLALGLTTAAAALSCGGSSHKPAAQPSAAAAGDAGAAGDEVPDPECCCQRYDEDGSPTGAGVSDTTACKSTGGTCTDDQTQCSED